MMAVKHSACHNRACAVLTKHKHRRSQKPEIFLGAQCWICQIFLGEGVELRRQGEVWRGNTFPENFLFFDLKVVNFGAF